jgi:hypothetical protein
LVLAKIDLGRRLEHKMLDPWIIEEIRKREELERDEQPVIEIPIERPEDIDQAVREEDDGEKRGVAIVDFRV